MARREALRLFPEYKHSFVHMQVSLAQYAEIDWDSGRSVVAKRERPPEVPPCVAKALNVSKKPPRIKGEGAE